MLLVVYAAAHGLLLHLVLRGLACSHVALRAA